MTEKIELNPESHTCITVPIDCLLESEPFKHPLLRNEDEVRRIAAAFNEMMLLAIGWISATRGANSQETHAPFCLLDTNWQTNGFVTFGFGVQDLDKVEP